MIKVGVFYPSTPGARFDMKYYLEKHIPMVKQKIGPALKNVAVEQGVAGGQPGAPITYSVIAPSVLRLGRRVSKHVRAKRASDSGRCAELHGHPADRTNQRSEDVGSGPAIYALTSATPTGTNARFSERLARNATTKDRDTKRGPSTPRRSAPFGTLRGQDDRGTKAIGQDWGRRSTASQERHSENITKSLMLSSRRAA
jgi:hypothetical protein